MKRRRRRAAALPRERPAAESVAETPPLEPAGSGWLEARWLAPAAWTCIGIAVLALASVAIFAHPIGDYFTESDFFDYAGGARGIARGVVAAERYGIVGPIYEFVLALGAALHLPLMPFAMAVSIAAAATTLACWFVTARRALGAAAGLWTVLVIATNAVFFRYAYSMTTDVLAVGLQAGSVALLLAAGSMRGVAGAGALAALAFLTRYNGFALVPAALVHLAWLAPRPAAWRRRASIAYLAGFLVIALPWTAVSVSQGHWPGERLFQNATFFASTSGVDRNVQDRLPDAAEPAAPAESRPLLQRLAANVPDHVRRDALELLGWPVAALVVLGLASLALPGAARAWLPLGLPGLALFAGLAPVFYSDRYSIAVLPIYATLVGLALGSRGLARRTLVRGTPLLWLVALPALGWAVVQNVTLQGLVRAHLPIEVGEAARALAANSSPSDVVIARKGAIGFYARRGVVPFPNVLTLAELAAHARAHRAGFLYVSWYEALLRPSFWWLLDRTSGTPGLERVYESGGNPAVLYRIGPDFGGDPAWLADSNEVRLAIARAQVRVVDEGRTAGAHMLLGIDARAHGRAEESVRHFEAVARVRTKDPFVWIQLGHALIDAGRFDDARAVFEQAARLDPGDVSPRLGLGRVQFRSGDMRGAAETWRPVLDVLPDSATLVEMVKCYGRLGDTEALATIRRTLEAGGALQPAR